MITNILVTVLVLVALLLLPVLAGPDTRDGRDWQPRDQWDRARRGNPRG